MKTHFLSWTIAFIVASATFVKPACESKGVSTNKNISLIVYKDYNYNGEIYKNTTVQIEVTIEKISGRKRTPVWAKTFIATEISEFPEINEAIPEHLLIKKSKGKEYFEAVYTLKYSTYGQELILYGKQIMEPNNRVLKISI